MKVGAVACIWREDGAGSSRGFALVLIELALVPASQKSLVYSPATFIPFLYSASDASETY